MYEFLRNNLETLISIVISIISLIYTILYNGYLDKRLKKTEKINKENRQQDIFIKNFLSEQNIRASIIPYFNIVLKDDRIKKEDNILILEIGVINIGRESATNIQLSSKISEKELRVYFDSESYPRKQYNIYEYLSQYHAVVGEEITFKIKVKLENREIDDFVKFKIKYFDLIGNGYEQEFMFGFYMLDNCIKYNLNNRSYEPALLKK